MERSVPLAAPFVVIRPAVPEDLAFIFSTWLKSYYYNSPAVMHVPSDLYYKKHHELASKILGRSIVPVACLKDSPAVIVGFAVLEMKQPVCLHYVYVKLTWRQKGVARMLLGKLDPNTCTYSHFTSAVKGWPKAKWPHLVYDPYLQHSS